MQTFDVTDYATRFAGKSSAIKRPREITYFSYDENHALKHDESSLRYYYTPDLNVDLGQGYNSFVKHDDSVDEHLDSLLDALVELERKEGRISTEGVHFVTWRGMMTKIMTVPYLEDGFEMNAVFHEGTIFIEENNLYKQSTRGTQDERGARMSFWGYKFETLSTLSRPWGEATREEIENRTREIVNNKAQYCSIVQTGFGDSGIIIAGEVDAIWDCRPMNPANPINYVELKTSRQVSSTNQQINFEKKLQRFWAQSFLLGVPKIIIGFRDDYGILKNVEIKETQGIPTGIRKAHAAQGLGPPPWNGNVAINFTTAFLEWLKGVLAGKEGLWRIRYQQRGSRIEVFQVQESGSAGVLTDRFLEWRRELQQKLRMEVPPKAGLEAEASI
ncbi:decapping endonuclease targeting mRNA [Orbilia javanica]|uniref:Decapping nuclease n=1 Tax=Orbilia javanica TaxID=47235 RepID=A0AAN8RKC4_9PEZI